MQCKDLKKSFSSHRSTAITFIPSSELKNLSIYFKKPHAFFDHMEGNGVGNVGVVFSCI